MKPKISIIVPIYNVEKYLSRCMNSLLTQSFQEIEVIAVNDGSTDSSLEIITTYVAMDPRVKVIDKENGGVSSARNAGIATACGEYIGFVDPDDWVDKKMYEKLYQTAITDKADIVMCSYIREFGSHSKIKDFYLPEKVSYYNNDVQKTIMRRLVGPLNEEVGNPELLDAWGTVWSKLYKAELIKKNGLSFRDLTEIGTNEDTLFNIHAFYFADTFTFLNQPFYHYWRVNESSVTSGYKPNLMNQWFKLYKIIEDFLLDKGVGEDYYKALNNRICLNILGFGLNTISKSNQSSMTGKLLKIKETLNNERIRRSFKQLDLSAFPIVWKSFYFCAKYRWVVGLYLLLLSIEELRKRKR